jgi:3-oxoadipate enol-lactonase
LVLIHAGVANLRMWDEHLPHFAERYEVITYDTRDGATESEHVPFSNRADLEAALDSVGAASAFVLGASRGGIIALDFAIEHSDRVDALVVVGGGIGGYASPVTEDESIWDRAERWEAHRWNDLSDSETSWWVDEPGQPPDRAEPRIRAKVHQWILSTYEAEKEEGIPQPLDPPAVGRRGENHVPTLVVIGDLDDRSTQDACRKPAAEIVGARLEVFEGVAHMINMEQPDRFTALVLDFLSGVEAARS